MIPPVDRQASDFAAGLTNVVRTVCPQAVPFEVDIAGDDPWLASVNTEDMGPIVLTINKRKLLDLVVTYKCSMNRGNDYLRVDHSSFKVRPHLGGEWLARLDYDRSPSQHDPCAHLHVHAHRDAWTFLMTRDGIGSQRRAVKRRGDAEKTPLLADVHFPAGGPRLRPALEDFLTMLIQELGIDHDDDAIDVLAHARAKWRQQQTEAIIASVPDIAAGVLGQLGWKVTPPSGHERAEHLPAWFERY